MVLVKKSFGKFRLIAKSKNKLHPSQRVFGILKKKHLLKK
jgi:hypothetical protein